MSKGPDMQGYVLEDTPHVQMIAQQRSEYMRIESREYVLQVAIDHLRTNAAQGSAMLVLAPSGSGKTSLLARAVDECMKDMTSFHVSIVRFLGTNQLSINH